MKKTISDLFDDYLNIKTNVEQKDNLQVRDIYFNYGATEYSFLEEIFHKYPFDYNDHLIDFGCGKGRVLIMAAYYSCKYLTGYEMDVDRYNILKDNVSRFKSHHKNEAVFTLFNQNVANMHIDDSINKIFFFEPFHLKIYIKVFNEIKNSITRNNRELLIILYKPFKSTFNYLSELDYFKIVDIKESNYKKGHDEIHCYEYIVLTNTMICQEV